MTGRIAFSLWKWQGDYYSRDIPGGVEVAPHTGSIYTVNADGSEPYCVFSQPGRDANLPTFSPDGRWLTFQSDLAGHHQIYRCRPDGSELVNLTAGDALGAEWREAYGFALSGDGRKMVYTIHNGVMGRAVLANADGSVPRLAAPHLGYTYMAALDTSGERVVFSGPADGYRLKLLTVADERVTDLTPHHPNSYVPRFTPNGEWIVFFRRDGEVYRVRAEGGPVERLTKGRDYVRFRLSDQDAHGSSDEPAISPDGTRIAHIGVYDGTPNVYVMNLDGGQPRQLTFRKEPCGRVRWSQDGAWLAFVSFVGPYTQLFVVSADGGEPYQVTHFDAAVYMLAWQP